MLYKTKKISKKLKFKRFFWNLIYTLFIRIFPRKSFNKWNIFLYNLFGAKVSFKATIYSSAKVYMPWNLEMQDYSCLASNVNCYNVDNVILMKGALVSQNSTLCTASHDIYNVNFSLITSPIIIKENAWVATEAFIGPGVIIFEGAVVGARSCVFKDVHCWTVVAGNPCKVINKRILY